MARDKSTQSKLAAPLRTKSYFAPSIQSAIASARAELGEDLLLVTSHATVGRDRQFGEYEVVFAIDDPGSPSIAEGSGPEELSVAVPRSFRDVLSTMLPSVTTLPSTNEEKLTHVHLFLADLGLSPADADRVMDLIAACMPQSPEQSCSSNGETTLPLLGEGDAENSASQLPLQSLRTNSSLVSMTQKPTTIPGTQRMPRRSSSSAAFTNVSLAVILFAGAAGIYRVWKGGYARISN